MPILTRLREGPSMLFYLSVTGQPMSSVLVHETYKVERLVYFLIKVFKGAETRYQNIDKLALVIVVAMRS